MDRGGISISNVTGALGRGPHGSIETFEDKVKRTSQRLAQQGVVLYIVDAKGLDVAWSQTAESPGSLPVQGRGRFESQQDAERLSNDTFPAMDMMSSITGGRYLRNSNDLAAGFKSAAADLAGSYTLGFSWRAQVASQRLRAASHQTRPGFAIVSCGAECSSRSPAGCASTASSSSNMAGASGFVK
jgi:VWFA-related protein